MQGPIWGLHGLHVSMGVFNCACGTLLEPGRDGSGGGWHAAQVGGGGVRAKSREIAQNEHFQEAVPHHTGPFGSHVHVHCAVHGNVEA